MVEQTKGNITYITYTNITEANKVTRKKQNTFNLVEKARGEQLLSTILL